MAVNVYVVVEVGLTVVEPEAFVELKLPGVIVMEVAPLVFHDKVEEDPLLMAAGEAVNEEIEGAVATGFSATMASAQGPLLAEVQVSV